MSLTHTDFSSTQKSFICVQWRDTLQQCATTTGDTKDTHTRWCIWSFPVWTRSNLQPHFSPWSTAECDFILKDTEHHISISIQFFCFIFFLFITDWRWRAARQKNGCQPVHEFPKVKQVCLLRWRQADKSTKPVPSEAAEAWSCNFSKKLS